MPETPYIAQYMKGSKVLIVDGQALEEFRRTWKLHHKLQPEQMNYGNQSAEVADVSFYHGGDVLYQLSGIPGYWHECCLRDPQVQKDSAC